MSKFCGCYLLSLISYQRIRDVLRLNIRVYGIIRYVKSLLILFVYLRVRTYTTLLLHEREKNGKGGREGKQERKKEAEEAPGNCLRGRQHGEMLWNMRSEEQPRECDKHESAISQ